MKITNYIIQSSEVEKAKALEYLQRQAIFLKDSYYASMSLKPYRGGDQISVELAILMKQEMEKIFGNWNENQCPIQVKLVPRESMPKVYKEIKSMTPDCKSPELPLGLYWLVCFDDRVADSKMSKDLAENPSWTPHTMSLFVDTDYCKTLETYLKTL